MGKLATILTLASLTCGVMSIIIDENSQGPLHRAKRYATYPRVPLAYMNKINPDSVIGEDGPIALPSTSLYSKRFMHEQEMTPASHFREFRYPQNYRADMEQNSVPQARYPGGLQRYTRQFLGSQKGGYGYDTNAAEEIINQLGPLSDEDLQTILLMLDGYALSSAKGNSARSHKNEEPKVPVEQYYNPSYLSPDDLRRVARLYAMGKRENDPGTFFDIEQPANMDNGADKVEFITSKRSKRVGPKNPETNRYKKETDPKVVEELEKIFSPPKALPLSQDAATTDKTEVTTHEHSGHTDPGQGQIPAPGSLTGPKAKRINWSEYFGIDKKNAKPEIQQAPKATEQQGTSEHDATTFSPVPVKPKAIVASRITEPIQTTPKESKEHKKLKVREENETENKSDRKWILNEFYKNLAMSTNVKRKRETNSLDEADELADLEQKMENAGDKIIWDTLKFTQTENPTSELTQIKKDIIEKLASTYSLDKLRDAVESFRDQLTSLKTNTV